jgi:hypothetical protein
LIERMIRMKRTRAFFVLLALASAISAVGQNPSQQNDGFMPLFNGKDFQGWVNVNCAPETWTVRDGMIQCTGIPTGVLRTTRQYENFILELEWRHMKKEGNAGLFIHSDALTAAGQPFTRSIECQVMDGNHGDMFAIHGASLAEDNPQPKGWLRSYPKEARAKPAGEWNHYRVESRDGTLTLAVNGKVVTRGFHLRPRRGYICLESEGSEIVFRNIRIRELPGTDPPVEQIAEADRAFHSLYNGLDLRGWKQAEGNQNHWKARDWILAYDGMSEAQGEDRHLWTEKEYGNFTLIVDWRLPRDPVVESVPVILPDGTEAIDENGGGITIPVMDAGDSGIYLRGTEKCQVNIWNWPVGSGEIWGYRTDQEMPKEVRKACTPILQADNKPGEWNRFEITAIGDTVTVVLNGKTVIDRARLPGLPRSGSIALQHHGDPVEFANIYIKEL